MIVKDMIAWLEELPQDEEVKYANRAHGLIALMVYDGDDPKDYYESEGLERL